MGRFPAFHNATSRVLQFVLSVLWVVILSNSGGSEEFGLELRALTGVRGYSLLFSGLSFSARSGQFIVLKGPNGSGKTTLLRMIAGLIRPETGEIDRPEEIGEQGPFYLGHDHGLRPNETPVSHLKDWADLHHAPRSAISPAIDRMGLKARSMVPAHALSAGQKKRVGLARALTSPRKLWLLDEPAAALDVKGQALLCDLITEHKNAGGICVAALHDPLNLTPDGVIDMMDAQP